VPLMPPRSDELPRMVRVRQNLYSAPLGEEELASAAKNAVAELRVARKLAPGASVAVGAGSRGIDNYALIVRLVVEELKAAGVKPFIFPAMGSHGGATVEGQRRVLESLGITELSLGCPIRATMEVATVGETASGQPVFLDRFASEADGIVVVNRIKQHTNFRAPLESGLMKMLAIGAGKDRQASAIHRHGVPGLVDLMPRVARAVLRKSPVLGGIGILEDGRHRTARIVGVSAEAMESTEIELLDETRQWQPKLPVNELDLLIVDRIGKNISGTGMDPNVIGRCRLPDLSAFPEPVIRAITVHDITNESHGNGIGVGLADVVTRAVADKFDAKATYINSLTAGGPAKAAMPPVAENDYDAVRTAFDYLLPPKPMSRQRVIRIRDTLNLEEMLVSEAIAAEIADDASVTLAGPFGELAFDDQGSLTAIW
jgi:hypothetical protein